MKLMKPTKVMLQRDIVVLKNSNERLSVRVAELTTTNEMLKNLLKTVPNVTMTIALEKVTQALTQAMTLTAQANERLTDAYRRKS